VGLFKRWAIQLGLFVLLFLYGMMVLAPLRSPAAHAPGWKPWFILLDSLSSPTLIMWRLAFFILGLVGVISTYKLGFLLYNKRIGFVAALILASSNILIQDFAGMSPVLMIASSLVYAIWQLMEFAYYRRWHNLILGGVGLGIAITVGGLTALLLPALGLGIYFIGKGQYRKMIGWRWLVPLGISLSIYAIFLWGFAGAGFPLERHWLHYPGLWSPGDLWSFKPDNALVFLFFFIPWSPAICWAFGWRVYDLGRSLIKRQAFQEWLSPGIFFIVMVISLFASEWYANLWLLAGPFAAIMAAEFVLRMIMETKGIGSWILRLIQMITALLIVYLVGQDLWANNAPWTVLLVGLSLVFIISIHVLQIDEPLDQAIMVPFFASILLLLVFLFNHFGKIAA
jgi:hypothetical protein